MKRERFFYKKFKALETVLYFREYSLFFRFYILILTIIIVLIVAFSIYISNLLSRNEAVRTQQINEQVAARTVSQMNNSIYFLNQILSVAGTNRYVIDAAVRPGLFYADRNQNVVAFIKDIPKNNVFINKIWLYEITDNLVFVSDGTVSPFDQYSSANVLDGIMRQAEDRTETAVIGSTEKNQTVITLLNGEVYLMYSALRSKDGEFLFKLIAKINTPYLFQDTVKEVENLGYGIEITSPSDALLYSNRSHMENISDTAEIALHDGSFGWTYSLYPLQYAGSDWLYITRQAIPFIAAATFFSLLLALLLAEKMYAPISKVTKNILKTGGELPQPPKRHDEIGFLYQTYSSILQDKKRAEYLIQDIRPELEKQLFLLLINGAEMEESALEQRLADIHSELQTQGIYQVMTLHYTDLDESGDVASYLSIREIERGVEALFPAKAGHIRYVQKGHIGIILLQYPAGTPADTIASTEAAFEDHVQLLLQAQGVRVLLAWGNPHVALRNMPLSCQEAYDRLKRQIYLQSDGESSCDDAPVPDDITQEYFAKKIDHLKSLMNSSDIASAEAYLHQLLQEFRGTDLALAQQKQAYGRLLDTLIEKSLQFHAGSCCSTEDYQEMYRSLELSAGQVQLAQRMEPNVVRIFGFVRTQLLRRQNRIVEKAKEYISENYDNGDLSAQMIADSIGITPSYLSNLFTTQTGESLVAYLNEYRVQIAIHLLQSTSISIKEIGFRTGFNTSQNFNRVFKRVTGKTPGKYREKRSEP